MADTTTLTATLPDDSLYVTGTVNGAETTWTLVETGTWQTVAAKATDDVYLCVVTIITSTGSTSTSTFTLYDGLHLITDRTAEDLSTYKQLRALGYDAMTDDQQAQWDAAALKGAYNYTDLNRVESAVSYISTGLNNWKAEMQEYAAGYGVAWDGDYFTDPAVGDLTIYLLWDSGSLPDADDLARYLGNVLACNTLGVDETGVPTTMAALTYTGANAIEQLLLDIWAALQAKTTQAQLDVQHAAESFVQSGQITSALLTGFGR